MAGLVNRIKHMVGLEPEFGDEEDIYDELYGLANEDEEEEIIQDKVQDRNTKKDKRSNLRVLSHPSASNYEVMVIEPKTFEESLEVVNNLRNRKSLILNLHLLDADQSQRVVDFVSGATHAIDGHQQKVGEGVFVFTPNNVSLSVETEKTRLMRDAFWTQA